MNPAAPHLSPPETDGAGIYRPNVAAIVTDQVGKILVCERSGMEGSWQFPQGGLEAGEAPEAGLARELAEELSLREEDYRIGQRNGPYRYLFPPGRTKAGFRGQEQVYFRVTLLSDVRCINLATEHHEFQAARWIEPAEFDLAWLPEMKRPVYAAVFRDFFGLNLEPARTPVAVGMPS